MFAGEELGANSLQGASRSPGLPAEERAETCLAAFGSCPASASETLAAVSSLCLCEPGLCEPGRGAVCPMAAGMDKLRLDGQELQTFTIPRVWRPESKISTLAGLVSSSIWWLLAILGLWPHHSDVCLYRPVACLLSVRIMSVSIRNTLSFDYRPTLIQNGLTLRRLT